MQMYACCTHVSQISRKNVLQGVGPTTSSSSQLIKTSKSFNVVGAIHPILKKRMSLNEAISEGILGRSRFPGFYCYSFTVFIAGICEFRIIFMLFSFSTAIKFPGENLQLFKLNY